MDTLTCDTKLIAATTFHVATARTVNCKNNPIAAPGAFHSFLRFDLTWLLTLDKLVNAVACQDRDHQRCRILWQFMV
jgi:hypothetical protein